MNAVSEDIKDMLLADSELAFCFATDLFTSREPAKPDNCITIFDTPGMAPQLAFTNQGYEYPSFQIRVRNTRFENAWEIAERIKTVLHGRANETWNGTLYTVIYCTNGPVQLDWDENNNVRLIINFNAQRR